MTRMQTAGNATTLEPGAREMISIVLQRDARLVKFQLRATHVSRFRRLLRRAPRVVVDSLTVDGEEFPFLVGEIVGRDVVTCDCDPALLVSRGAAIRVGLDNTRAGRVYVSFGVFVVADGL